MKKYMATLSGYSVATLLLCHYSLYRAILTFDTTLIGNTEEYSFSFNSFPFLSF